jgi:hypothetical protein
LKKKKLEPLVKLGSFHFRYALLLLVQTCAVVLLLAGLELKFIYADRPVAFPMEARQAAVDANTGPASALSLRLAAQAGPRLRDHACMADFISFRASKRGPVCSVLQPPGVDDARSARQGKAREFNSIGWLQRSLADRLADDVVSAIPLPSSSCSHQHGSRA